MDPADTIRIIVVDDHRVVRAGIKSILEDEPSMKVVGEASSVGEAGPLLAATKAHLALVDMRLPDGSGAEACRRLKDLDPAVKVVVLTSFAEERLVFAALAAGADGYLMKDCRDDTLIQALLAILNGSQVLAPAALAIVTGPKAGDPAGGGLGHLTPREMSILGRLAKGATYREIAAELSIAEKTVRNTISQMMWKCDARTRNQLVALYVGGHGGAVR